jgi:hypothetical protein
LHSQRKKKATLVLRHIIIKFCRHEVITFTVGFAQNPGLFEEKIPAFDPGFWAKSQMRDLGRSRVIYNIVCRCPGCEAVSQAVNG